VKNTKTRSPLEGYYNLNRQLHFNLNRHSYSVHLGVYQYQGEDKQVAVSTEREFVIQDGENLHKVPQVRHHHHYKVSGDPEVGQHSATSPEIRQAD